MILTGQAMPKVVTSPPSRALQPDGLYPGGWWHDTPETGRIVCDLCPRACSLKPGDRGFCFVRQNHGGEMMLTTFGRSTGFCIDPIEKKPLNQFYPGTSVLSFGTAGCNLGCKFCQNWDISKSKEIERLSKVATPDAIAEAARSLGCRSVAYTYNDPVIWAEYAIETARACRAVGVKSVAVTAGYITPEARGAFFEFMDAANVDLKGFTEEFYHHITYSHLKPVLDTLAWLKHETDVWFEITNLVIPEANDASDDLQRMCGWVLETCGDEVPLHFSAFHPDFRMMDRPNTPHETLLRAHEIARVAGLKYVYVGNVNDPARQSTYCPRCGKLVVERNWYQLGAYHLRGDRCGHCGEALSGRYDLQPGSWGRKRVPIEITQYGQAAVPQVVTLSTARPSMPPRSDAAPTAASGQTGLAPSAPVLSAEHRRAILAAAARFVGSALLNRDLGPGDPTLEGAAGLPVAGAYVTLKRQGHLRACCGTLGAERPLLAMLRHASQQTAREDHRLPPISLTELPYLDLSVNLLFAFEPVSAQGRQRIAAVQVGRHGLRIQRGDAGGLLLPIVAVENAWDSETFLRQVCRKAGLPTNAWEGDDTILMRFESVEFGGPFETGVLRFDPLSPAPVAPLAPLRQVADHARSNVLSLLQGLTPVYYVAGLPDGNVTGLVLTLAIPEVSDPIHLFQLSMRPGLPFQATLFGLCESAARTLGKRSAMPRSLRVGVTILTDPAIHGTAAAPDLRGLVPSRRALVAIDQDKSSLLYSPAATHDEMLAMLPRGGEWFNPTRVGLYSVNAQSTEESIVFRSAPRAAAETAGVRPAAVAGRFYPSDPGDLSRLVDGLLAATPRRPQRWSAAMVPHAGLVFSGKVAASVFNRLEIPECVIIIGPKHTRQGVDWSVAPHETWSIPGAELPSDPALARALASAIPGLQLDAAAHRHEHAIEVELPFLARLAPASRVVGMAIGAGDWDHCRQFAAGLAQVVRSLPTPPLLLISSDMNHFANDRETRLLDETALDAMSRLDPAGLLATVTEHEISMCGVLPAVIVMETLRQLGGLHTCERVSYATSAEVSGDPSRVVGYAGVLLNWRSRSAVRLHAMRPRNRPSIESHK